jgi:DNA polymerase-3 subunit delta'
VTKLKDIFGQDDAIERLRAAFGADRLAHGLIFAGPEGVGKATAATALGAWFLCEKPGKEDACGQCESCKAMAAGAHPDFHVITKEMARLIDKSGTSKATQLSINVIREYVVDPAGRKTVMGRGKVFVIEQAELMTTAAQNGLLKTLEEPLGRTLIVLLTTHANELLPTVRSRSQTIRFVGFPCELVVRELKKRGVDAQAAKEAADLTDGSLGVALRWIEDGILTSAQSVAKSVDVAMAKSGAGSELAEVVRKSADEYAAKVLARDELASKDSAVRTGLGMYLGIAVRRIRGKLADEPVTERACAAIDAIGRAEMYLDANVNVSLVMEQLGAAI